LTTKIQKYGIFPEFILNSVFVASKFIFKKVSYHFINEQFKPLNLPYPTVYFANHVTELDIAGLSTVHRIIKKPRIKYTIPIREDLIQKNFLIKEFRPKGIMKYFLHLIDLSGILPQLFKIVGAVPVKRPFRDNARAMIKDGSMRDQVDKDWRILSENIDLGKNVVVFPEGIFSDDGNLRAIKNGIAHLTEKKPGLNYFYFNFTYDFLTESKPCLYIGFGELFKMPESIAKEEITAIVKDRLASVYVVTPANLTSYFILNSSNYEGKNLEWIISSIQNLAKGLKVKGKILVDNEILSGDTKRIESVINLMVRKKVLLLDGNGKYSKGTKYEIEINPDKHKNFKKEHPFAYHKNQLRYFDDVLQNIGSK
jgi:hypothetical protein